MAPNQAAPFPAALGMRRNSCWLAPYDLTMSLGYYRVPKVRRSGV